MLHRTNFKIFLLLLRIHRSCCYCVPIQQDSIEAYIEAFQQFAGYDLNASRHSTKGILPNKLAGIVFKYSQIALRRSFVRIWILLFQSRCSFVLMWIFLFAFQLRTKSIIVAWSTSAFQRFAAKFKMNYTMEYTAL
jgi:hypothetical protein